MVAVVVIVVVVVVVVVEVVVVVVVVVVIAVVATALVAVAAIAAISIVAVALFVVVVVVVLAVTVAASSSSSLPSSLLLRQCHRCHESWLLLLLVVVVVAAAVAVLLFCHGRNCVPELYKKMQVNVHSCYLVAIVNKASGVEIFGIVVIITFDNELLFVIAKYRVWPTNQSRVSQSIKKDMYGKQQQQPSIATRAATATAPTVCMVNNDNSGP